MVVVKVERNFVRHEIDRKVKRGQKRKMETDRKEG
jgi:hypothetical protein